MMHESRELHTTPSGTIRPFTRRLSPYPGKRATLACASGVLDHSWDEARRRYEQRSAIEELLARARASLDRVEPEHLADEVAPGAIPIDIRPLNNDSETASYPAPSSSTGMFSGGASTLPLLISYLLQPTSIFATSWCATRGIARALRRPCYVSLSASGYRPGGRLRRCWPCSGAPTQDRPTPARRGRTASRRSHQ
jgi:hypothetical protein